MYVEFVNATVWGPAVIPPRSTVAAAGPRLLYVRSCVSYVEVLKLLRANAMLPGTFFPSLLPFLCVYVLSYTHTYALS